ncbi:hypothetical protein C8R44DRAFT_755087 [Mycena epipterygia]|nr:hypothetical protein C8R44DRAFT_755087 [Mycena epipterygia]
MSVLVAFSKPRIHRNHQRLDNYTARLPTELIARIFTELFQRVTLLHWVALPFHRGAVAAVCYEWKQIAYSRASTSPGHFVTLEQQFPFCIAALRSNVSHMFFRFILPRWTDDALVYASLTHLTLEHISQSMNLWWDAVKAMLEQAVNVTELTLVDVDCGDQELRPVRMGKLCRLAVELDKPSSLILAAALRAPFLKDAHIDRVLAASSATALELFVGELYFAPLLVAVAKASGRILANLAPWGCLVTSPMSLWRQVLEWHIDEGVVRAEAIGCGRKSRVEKGEKPGSKTVKLAKDGGRNDNPGPSFGFHNPLDVVRE